MRAMLVFLLSAGVLAFAQGSPSHAHAHARAVQYSCDISKIESEVKGLVSDASAAVEDVRTDIYELYTDLDGCVEAFFSDLDVSALITCASDAVQSAVVEVKADVLGFYSEAESTAEEVLDLIKQCVTL